MLRVGHTMQGVKVCSQTIEKSLTVFKSLSARIYLIVTLAFKNTFFNFSSALFRYWNVLLELDHLCV